MAETLRSQPPPGKTRETPAAEDEFSAGYEPGWPDSLSPGPGAGSAHRGQRGERVLLADNQLLVLVRDVAFNVTLWEKSRGGVFLGLGLVKPAGVKDLALWHKYPPTQSPCSQLPGRTSEHAQERTEKYVPCASTPHPRPRTEPSGNKEGIRAPSEGGAWGRRGHTPCRSGWPGCTGPRRCPRPPPA